MIMATIEPKTGEDKKKRKRNKQLLRSIRQQIEFYFGDANLRKDRFLKQEICQSRDRYVEIATIASFNKMKDLCSDPGLIPQALSTSDMLELSEDKTKVRRKTPLAEPEFDPDDVTVYVECLPKTVDHDWLRKVFGVCGSVEYVSLPRYRSTGDVKGFAFIEFKTPEEASKACQMLHNPPDEDSGKMGKFPKTRARRYIPVEDNGDGNIATHDHPEEDTKTTAKKRSHDHLEETSKTTGRKRSHDEDGERHGDSHKSHHKRRHSKSESSDGKPDSATRHRRKRHHSDETNASHHSSKKHKHESTKQHKKEMERSDVDSVEKEHKRKKEDTKEKDGEHKSEKSDKKDDEKHSTSQGSKDTESPKSRKRKHTDGESLSDDQDGKKNRKDDASLEGKRSKGHDLLSGDVERSDRKDEGKRKHTDDEPASEDHGGKKNKKDDASSEGKRSKGHDLLPDDDDERSDQKDEGQAKKESDSDEKSKKKRVRKKKQEKKETKENDVQLRVISKKEWLDLKHQYLSLQKASLTRMKQALRRATVSDMTTDETTEKVVKSPDPEFTSGVVLKIETKKPIDSRKQLKDDLQTVAAVAYVDLQPGDQAGFVRCESVEGATQIINKYGPNVTSDNISVSLLTGEDETQYWEKLRADRSTKMNSKQRKKKKRGVDRLLCKAEKVSFSSGDKGSHIRFDDE